MAIRAISLIIFLLLPWTTASGQIGLYDKILDPLGIADLGGPDSLLVEHTSFVHGGYDLEPDGYRVFAKMQGPGIVSHIWATWIDGLMDTTSLIKVTIDDTMIYHGIISKFFVVGSGRLRGPLDTTQSGGLDCDIPLPFKRNFKLTYQGSYTFFALTWRDVSDPNLIYSFRPWDSTGVSDQESAEIVVRRSSIDELPLSNESVVKSLSIGPGISQEIFEDNGQGIIQKLHFLPQSFDTLAYRQVWLRCYWDGEPIPSIEVPLADLFGAVTGIKELNALQLKSSVKNGFECLLPMPFAHGAKIELVNRSSATVILSAEISVNRSPRVGRELGRLQVQFNETPVPRMHHFLPIAHAKGSGRFVGLIFNLPDHPDPPYYLEGNPNFIFDSSASHRIYYPGTEDYFNGGWYFSDGNFSLPFAGCPERWTMLYRFNYLDVLNFDHSLDVEWEHGRKNDFFEHYRTVAFLYLAPRPFWVLTDSLTQGDTLSLGGSGYEPLSSVTIAIGTSTTSVQADSEGRFRLQLPTAGLTIGDHQLAVNAVPHLRPVSILSSPVVEYVVDSQYSDPCIFDSLDITLRAFLPHKDVDVFLGSQLIGRARTDQRGLAWLTCRLANVPPGDHQLIAVQSSIIATAKRSVRITSTLRYEVEDMSVVSSDCSYGSSYHGWFNGFWSNDKIVFIYPSGVGQGVTLHFDVPYSDSFRIALSATKGVRYANMAVSIDGLYLGTIDGYFEAADFGPYVLPAQDLMPMLLTKGSHDIRFSVDSRDPRALEWALGPDMLFLTPTNTRAVASQKEYSASRMWYSGTTNTLRLQVSEELVGSIVEITLTDILGKPVCSLYTGEAREDMDVSIRCPQFIPGAYLATCRFDDGSVLSCLIIK